MLNYIWKCPQACGKADDIERWVRVTSAPAPARSQGLDIFSV